MSSSHKRKEVIDPQQTKTGPRAVIRVTIYASSPSLTRASLHIYFNKVGVADPSDATREHKVKKRNGGGADPL